MNQNNDGAIRDCAAAAYRLQVLSRAVAAVGGGYLLSNLAAIFLARVLPLPLPEAVLGMTLLSFALYAAAVLWVFAVRSARTAWFGLLGASALLAGLSFLLTLASAP